MHLSQIQYDNYPILCKQCNIPINYSKYKQAKYNPKFCTKSCNVTFNNKLRNISKSHRNKVAETLFLKNIKITGKGSKQYKIPSFMISGIFTKIRYCKCRHCNSTFISKRNIMFCKLHNHLYNSDTRNKYEFSFNLSKYSYLFNNYADYLIKGIGSHLNPYGFNKDHKLSVVDAIKYNYDPYYITHPLNCELLTWIDNKKKRDKSSISYHELITIVNIYQST